MLKNTINIVKKNLWLFILAVLFVMPNWILLCSHLLQGNFFPSIKSFFYLLLTLNLFFIPVILVPKLNIKVYLMLLLPYYIIIPFISFTVILIGKWPTKTLLYVVFSANRSEVFEFISGSGFWIISTLIYYVFIIYAIIKQIPLKIFVKSKWKYYTIGMLIFLFISLVIYNNLRFDKITSPSKLAKRFVKETPVGFLIKMVKTIKVLKTPIYTPELNNINIQRSSYPGKEVYVLVIGESSRYDHWQINGYERQTTPRIQKIKNLVNLDSAYAPALFTNSGIPLMLSPVDSKNYRRIDSAGTSIIDYFKSSGFKCYWISNQSNLVNRVGRIANKAHTHLILSCGKLSCYDELLIDEFERILQSDDQKQFIVLHQMGSHYPYQKRYPEPFRKFKPDLGNNNHISLSRKSREKHINSYDNTILYTDYVLSELIRCLEKRETISGLIFCSDHGENLFDHSQRSFGRGLGSFSFDLYHVPMFIWTSDIYKNKNPQVINNLNINRNKLYSSDHLFYSMLDLARFQLNKEDLQKSLLSDLYIPDSVYVLTPSNNVIPLTNH